MSLQTALTSLRTAIESTGLTNEEGDDQTLFDSSRAEFDGAYLLRVDSAVTLYRELKRSPEAFKVKLAVEIGTEHKHEEDFAACQIRAGHRSTALITALVAANHADVVNIYSEGAGSTRTVERQQVTTHFFQLIFRG